MKYADVISGRVLLDMVTNLVKIAHVAVCIHQARIQNNGHAICLHRFLELSELHIGTGKVVVSIAKPWLQLDGLAGNKGEEGGRLKRKI